jgi:hypothetical protein
MPTRAATGAEVGDESVTQMPGGRSFRVWLLRDFE